jgi:hypothetical protein
MKRAELRAPGRINLILGICAELKMNALRGKQRVPRPGTRTA